MRNLNTTDSQSNTINKKKQTNKQNNSNIENRDKLPSKHYELNF